MEYLLRNGFEEIFVETISDAYNNQVGSILDERKLYTTQIRDLNKKIDRARELFSNRFVEWNCSTYLPENKDLKAKKMGQKSSKKSLPHWGRFWYCCRPIFLLTWMRLQIYRIKLNWLIIEVLQIQLIISFSCATNDSLWWYLLLRYKSVDHQSCLEIKFLQKNY